MMKEFKIEDIMPLEAVKSKIWMMFDILRVEQSVTSAFDYHVILFLLSTYKDNLISLDLVNENHQIKERLIERLRNPENELHSHYAPILESFEPSIQRLSEKGLKNLFSILVEIDKRVLTENFPDIFDSVLYRISQSQGRYAGEFIQPVELTRFMYGLADLKKEAKVFNPFAGLASFGVYLDQGQDYFGQELNQKTWALGSLRLMASERPGSVKYVCDDSILCWPDESEKFDLIISNPPFGMRLGNHFRDVDPNIRTIEQFLIEKGIQSLKQNGKLIALLPQGFLFRGMQERNLREYLVEEDLIDTIISLPGGLLFNTGIPLIILVLAKNKKLPGKVRFVDAKDFVISKGPREKVLNDQELLSHLRGNQIDNLQNQQNLVQEPPEDYNSLDGNGNKIQSTGIERVVGLSQIQKFDYNLSVGRYFKKQIDGVKLGDILELVKGQRGNLPETGKLIRIRDLKDDKIDFRLNVSEIEDVELRRPDLHQINETCLLLAIRWRTLKPTLFEFNGEPIYRSQDILSFKVNEEVTDKAYLINELLSDYVQEQIESYRLGAVIPFIRKDDLMEVVIKLPSIEVQQAKVEGVKQSLIKAHENELKLQSKLLDIKEDTFKDFASIKHTFRQYLGALKSNVIGTRKFLTKKDGYVISLNEIYSAKLNQTLGEHLISLEDIISSMAKLLDAESYTSDSKNTETINLVELVERAQERLKQNVFEFENIFVDKYSFKINLENDGDFSDEKVIDPLIDINKEDFFKLFSNIISNAINHGFENRIGNIIRSVISYDSTNESCILEVSNNGRPMAEKFTLGHLTTRGEKTTDSQGTGIGGADIKDIVSLYNGTFELIKDVNSSFPVTYRIGFPIKKTTIENDEIQSSLD